MIQSCRRLNFKPDTDLTAAASRARAAFSAWSSSSLFLLRSIPFCGVFWSADVRGVGESHAREILNFQISRGFRFVAKTANAPEHENVVCWCIPKIGFVHFSCQEVETV